MIQVPTTLVLGAGASASFGYPLGERLLYAICGELQHAKFQNVSGGFVRNPARAQLDKFGSNQSFGDDYIESFVKALRYSGQPSVDAFLINRPEFANIATAAVAQILLKYEMWQEMAERGQVNTEKDAEQVRGMFAEGQNLYKYIFSHLTGTSGQFSPHLAVVTFNYDLSFEHFLHTAIKNSYNLDDAQAREHISDYVRIFHVHGSLTPLFWQSSDGITGRKYGDIGDIARHLTALRNSVAQMMIPAGKKLTEEQNRRFSEAYETFRGSNRIIFLGFGYDTTNLRNLRLISETFKRWSNLLLYGTCMGMTEHERNAVSRYFGDSITLGSPNQDALDFLKTGVNLDISLAELALREGGLLADAKSPQRK